MSEEDKEKDLERDKKISKILGKNIKLEECTMDMATAADEHVNKKEDTE